MAIKGKREKPKVQEVNASSELVWLKATYGFHSYAYRDPRSVFASAVALPVPSPTTILLGVASTLFRLGLADDAKSFLKVSHQCEVRIDPPNGAVFFRAFHQVRRYESDKWDEPAEGKINPRVGLTDINQGTREYGLLEGPMTIFLGIPKDHIEPAKMALINLTHLGTHDSLCSLVGEVETCTEPENIVYAPREELAQRIRDYGIPALGQGITIVTLSRFKSQRAIQPKSGHWYMAGGDDTELVKYAIPGRFEGTSRGKIYRKR
ncbi:MAG: hypothetical protein DDT32_01100 [Syntrophomonadaceae bacterium]|nr:hypothetical protein [Bacillota bacterium]MBT9147346.1 hypothetical protein [Bacillota bacterium]